MALVLGQATVGTTASFVTAVPAGPFMLTLVAGSASAVAVGSSTAVTVDNGALIPAGGSVSYQGFTGSSGAQLWAAAGAASSLSYHLCTDG